MLANDRTNSSNSIVLGKRKRQERYVLHLSGGSTAETGSDSHSEGEQGTSSTHSADKSDLMTGSKKTYLCDFEGCGKAYRKPSRLAEHQRSHTGERPFRCEICHKTYIRETHLQAHSRSHLDESQKPFACPKDGCSKRYWTAQHLKRHEDQHDGEKPFKCSENDCDCAFSKHSQLRTHFATEHCASGTKPFRCVYTGCSKSFYTSQKLTAHEKVHDEHRYRCTHPTCIQNGGSKHFRTWTQLQAHTRETHPPTCPYPSCKGKTFTQQKGLRSHLKIHEQREIEDQLKASAGFDADDEGEGATKRRRGGEIGRDWQCTEPNCDKAFKSKKALETHCNVSHLKKRDFPCPEPECNAAFGYKHLLQRHAARLHPALPKGSAAIESAPSHLNKAMQSANAIDDLTGKTYEEMVQKKKTIKCSEARRFFLGADRADQPYSPLQTQCGFAFSREYDLRRHLASAHKIEIDKHHCYELVLLLQEYIHSSA